MSLKSFTKVSRTPSIAEIKIEREARKVVPVGFEGTRVVVDGSGDCPASFFQACAQTASAREQVNCNGPTGVAL